MARARVPFPWWFLAGLFLAGSPAAGQPPPERASSGLERIAAAHFDGEFRRRARDYHRPRVLVFLVQLGVSLTLAAWILSGPGRDWLRSLPVLTPFPWLDRLAWLTAAYLAFALLRLPFRLYFYFHAREAGLRHDPLGGFLMDWTKGLAVGWVQVALAGLVLLWLFAALPRGGWFWGTAAVGLLAAAYITLSPLVVDPLFHRFRPLEDEALAARLRDVAARGGIDAEEFLVADASRRTRAVNAYFTGLGRSKRIVLYDTLVSKLEPEEVAVVVAHEVGHWRHRHVAWGLTAGVLGAGLGLWTLFAVLGRLAGAARGDPTLAVPAYALVVILLTVALVPSNLISRRMETQADRASLELTEDPGTFVRSEVRIARENLSDVVPPRWVEVLFYTHPAAARRIQLAGEVP